MDRVNINFWRAISARQYWRESKVVSEFLSEVATEQASTYLRLFYSPTLLERFSKFRQTHPDAGKSFLASLDVDIFALEQGARHRNLLRYLQRNVPGLCSLLDQESLLSAVSSFADSTDFWSFQGRTLTENFCLYVANAWSGLPSGSQWPLFVKFSGIVSGLGANCQSTSPWPDVAVSEKDLYRGEAFQSSCRLVTSSGEGPSARTLPEISELGNFIVCIVVTAHGKLTATSEKVDVR